MNALVKKEIRLLLPSWIAAVMLAAAPPWLFLLGGDLIGISLLLLWPSTILLAVSAFGRELSLGTFSMLLAQPSARLHIWKAKVSVLAFALLTVFSIFFVSVWRAAPWSQRHWELLLVCGVFILTAYSGGLWTTLLFRQVAAAFWIALVVPVALWFVTMQSLRQCGDRNAAIFGVAMLGPYAIAGFWWARHLFLRAQDVAWTGGEVSLPVWRLSRAQSKSLSQRQRHRPIAALFWKELQLQQSMLACAAALLALHLLILLLRVVTHGPIMQPEVLEGFWWISIVMPVLIGCTAVAEERKLGVAEWQRCLPVSDRVQFTVKCLLALGLSLLLGGVLPSFIGVCGLALGVPPLQTSWEALPPLSLGLMVCSLGLAIVAIYASTLARNILQALAVFVGAIVGIAVFLELLSHPLSHPLTVLGITIWRWSELPGSIGIPTITVTLLWLAYRNFKEFHDPWQVWRRNLLRLVAALAFVVVASVALYNRTWEVFMALEPPHGAPRLTLSNPPILEGGVDNATLTVLLPDGRVWLDDIDHPSPRSCRQVFAAMFRPLPRSLGPNQFVGGSNWADVATARWGTIGIGSDGSLWLSEETNGTPWIVPKLTGVVGDGNWQAVLMLGTYPSAVLLKRDGTLWWWGTNHAGWKFLEGGQWPGLQALEPQQLSTNLLAAQSFSLNEMRATGADAYWILASNSLVQTTCFDQKTQWRSQLGKLGIRDDGTLWICHTTRRAKSEPIQYEMIQLSRDTNWTAGAASGQLVVALKSDGSIWKWEGHGDEALAALANRAPTPLSMHHDWVAIARYRDGVISLAADGSLWFWPDRGAFEDWTLLRVSRKPALLANVFAQPN